MCRFKSAIILKDRVFITDVDSHTELLEQLKIADTRENAEKLFVRAELYPENNDVFSDINNWVFNVDQDILPEWFVKEYDKQRMVEAVKKWAENHIYIDKENIKVSGKVYLKNCKNVSCSNRTVYAYGNSTVEAYNNSTVKACGNSTVVIVAYSSNKKENIKLSDNATLKDCKTKTIYQSGDWKFERV